MLSVVITSYNRPEKLKECISSVLAQTYKNTEIIIADDCSSCDIRSVVNEFGDDRLRCIVNNENLGYTKNARNGLRNTNGQYVAFLADDDVLIFDRYFEEALEKLNKFNADMVFSRIKIISEFGEQVNKHDFKDTYNKREFIKLLEDLRFNYQDFFSLGSCIFYRDKLMTTGPFESIFRDSATSDLTTIFKYVLANKLFTALDRVVYGWTRPNSSSLSGSNKSNIVEQTMSHLSFPIDTYMLLQQSENELQKEIVEFLNKRIAYSYEAILADAAAERNKENFDRIITEHGFKDKDVYIYCRGWVGLSLEQRLAEKGIKIEGFLDDFKADGIVSTEVLKSGDRPTAVLIATYKYKDIYMIYRKLALIPGIEIYDLYQQ